MNKILKININDIIIDPARESEMITKACNRTIKMHLTGICQSGETLILIMEKDELNPPMTYILAPLNAANIDDITSEISSRYFAGFSTIGGFDLKSEKWALFAKQSE